MHKDGSAIQVQEPLNIGRGVPIGEGSGNVLYPSPDFYAFATQQMSAKALCLRAVRPPLSFIHLDISCLIPQCLMNGLTNFDKTSSYREYSLVPTDDLVRICRSTVRA